MDGVRAVIDCLLPTVFRIVRRIDVRDREIWMAIDEVPQTILEEHHRLVRYALSGSVPHFSLNASPGFYRFARDKGRYIARLDDKCAYQAMMTMVANIRHVVQKADLPRSILVGCRCQMLVGEPPVFAPVPSVVIGPMDDRSGDLGLRHMDANVAAASMQRADGAVVVAACITAVEFADVV
jgi:hypothetical protein